jgi:uncharacterized OB-fold protein
MSMYADYIAADASSAPFFEAARRGELMLLRCARCAAWSWPGVLNSPTPRPACSECLSFDVHWEQSAGRGRLYTYTVFHAAPADGWPDHVPYAVALVELAEGPRLFSNIVDCPIDELAIDMRLEVTFRAVGQAGTIVPLFRPPGLTGLS